MALDVSVAMSVEDNLSQAIVGMKNAMTPFRNDITELQKELDRLSNAKTSIRIDLDAARKELRDAKRDFEALGESATEADRAAAKANFDEASKNVENLRQQYALVSKQVKYTQRDIEDVTAAMSRAENRAAAASVQPNAASVQPQGAMSMLQSIGQAGLYSQIGAMASQWATAMGGSYLGSAGGNLLSGTLGGAGSGAAIGTMIAPGVGTAIGAAVGGLVGLAGGAAQNFETKDEYFKNYVQEAVEGQLSSMQESIAGGSTTAAQWELDRIAFNQLLGEGYGGRYLDAVKSFASSTPLEYSDLTAMSRALAPGFADGTISGLQRMMDLMEGIGNAGSALGVDASGMTVMAQVLSRMESSGKATLEYLNMFQERGVDVIGMLGEHYGVNQGEIYEMISDGAIAGQDAVDIIQNGMERYAGAMDTMSHTFSGLQSTLNDAQTAMDAAYGEGYNETRKQGLEDEISFLSGESGAMMEEANRAMGSYMANLENLKEDFVRKAIEAAMGDDDYIKAKAAGDAAEMGRIIMAAQQEGLAAYADSDEAKGYEQMQLDLINSVQESAAAHEESYLAGYNIGQEYSKGYIKALNDAIASGAIPSLTESPEAMSAMNSSEDAYKKRVQSTGGYAYGLNRVPYDGFRAILHEGERVLTAREAREADSTVARSVNVNISGQWSVRDDSDIDLIAARIADALERALAAGVGS